MEATEIQYEEVDLNALFASRTPPPVQPVAAPGEDEPGIDPDATQQHADMWEKHAADFEQGYMPPPPGSEDTISEIAAENVAISYDSKKLAESIVDAAETLLEVSGPFAFDISLAKEDRAALKMLAYKYRQSKDAGALSLNEEDQRVMTIYLDREDFIEDLPFSEKEKKSIVDPLAEILKASNAETSPTWALIIAAALVMLPRLLPILKNFFR